MFQGFLRRFGYEKKESRVLPTLITLGLDTPVWTPRDYEQLAKVGYQTNADVYACINLIIRSARQIPWLVSGKEGGTADIPKGASPCQPRPDTAAATTFEDDIQC